LKEQKMTENNSRRKFLATGLKALAVLVPAAAVMLSEKKAEAGVRRRVARRRYWW
jgi:hypothetical protein